MFSTTSFYLLVALIGLEYCQSIATTPKRPSIFRLCDFRRSNNRILRTVDAVFHSIKTESDCSQACVNLDDRCGSFDLGHPENPVCRISSRDAFALDHAEDPYYYEVVGGTTFAATSCYNVTVQCKSREMVARISASRPFNGKIYAKNSPSGCVNDVTDSQDFELSLPLFPESGSMCGVRQTETGRFATDVIIQRHDQVLTASDRCLELACRYDLTDKPVTNDMQFEVEGDVAAAETHESTVEGPTIRMMITDPSGSMTSSAQIGDTLALRFMVVDASNPFEIFVRNLVAYDDETGASIELIDSNGCPTDPSIMSHMVKIPAEESHQQVGNTSIRRKAHILQAIFDAFKFPSSDVVKFQALVTSCFPACQPAKCHIAAVTGTMDAGPQNLTEFIIDSYGRRRRRRRRRHASVSDDGRLTVSGTFDSGPSSTDVTLTQAIQILDRYIGRRSEHAPVHPPPRLNSKPLGLGSPPSMIKSPEWLLMKKPHQSSLSPEVASSSAPKSKSEPGSSSSSSYQHCISHSWFLVFGVFLFGAQAGFLLLFYWFFSSKYFLGRDDKVALQSDDQSTSSGYAPRSPTDTPCMCPAGSLDASSLTNPNKFKQQQHSHIYSATIHHSPQGEPTYQALSANRTRLARSQSIMSVNHAGMRGSSSPRSGAIYSGLQSSLGPVLGLDLGVQRSPGSGAIRQVTRNPLVKPHPSRLEAGVVVKSRRSSASSSSSSSLSSASLKRI